jgi:hypothetical protein
MKNCFPSGLAAAFLVALAAGKTNAPGATGQLTADKDHEFTEFFRRTDGWVAGDGALSVPLSDGRVIWFFGDSHIDDYEAASGTVPCLFQVRNAALFHNRGDLHQVSTLLGKKPGAKSLFTHPAAGKFWFWPVSGFQEGNTVLVYLTLLERTPEGGAWGFKAVGQYWGKLKFPELDVAGYVALPDFHGIDFGRGFAQEAGSGYTYAFGNKQDGIASTVYVARFQTTMPDRDWTFWDGQSWNADVSRAAVIGRGASTSVQVCRVNGRFLLTTSAFSVACDQGTDIFISTSSGPTGPFSDRKRIYTLDDTVEGHHPFFYLPVAHPELINDKNELLITYSINGYEPCVPSCVKGRMNPDYYRPRAIRLPLKLLEAQP